jgi:hypothetical protein
MDEALERALARAVSIALVRGHVNLGSVFLIFLVLIGAIAALQYATEKAQKGEPGCLISSLVVGVFLIAMFFCAN